MLASGVPLNLKLVGKIPQEPARSGSCIDSLFEALVHDYARFISWFHASPAKKSIVNYYTHSILRELQQEWSWEFCNFPF
jgi:hypothetical protein